METPGFLGSGGRAESGFSSEYLAMKRCLGGRPVGGACRGTRLADFCPGFRAETGEFAARGKGAARSRPRYPLLSPPPAAFAVLLELGSHARARVRRNSPDSPTASGSRWRRRAGAADRRRALRRERSRGDDVARTVRAARPEQDARRGGFRGASADPATG